MNSLKILILSLVLSVVFLSKPALADVYTLQIGKYNSREAVEKKWESLKKKNKKLLKNLELSTVGTVKPGFETMEYLLSVGPISQKKLAKKICKTLMKKGDVCFVMEIPVFLTNAQREKIEAERKARAKKAQQKKLLNADVKKIPAPVVDNLNNTPEFLQGADAANVTLPWLKDGYKQPDSDVKPEDISEIIESSENTEVKVSEAVLVGSANELEGAEVSKDKKIPSLYDPQSFSAFPSQDFRRKTYWVELRSFNDIQEAIDYWDQFKYNYPKRTRSLRVRVTKPYSKAKKQVISLRFGPLGKKSSVRDFCKLATKGNVTEKEPGYENNILCRLIEDLGKSTPALVNRGSRTLKRPKDIMKNSQKPESDARRYFAQLGTYETKDQAIDKWNALKIAHNDLLGSLDGNIKEPVFSSSDVVYRLRTGPFSSNYAATRICNKLELRFVSCIVTSGR